MSQEIDYGVKTFDFATDSTQEFVNGVAGVTDSNMHKLTNAIKNKVTLNGEASDQQNFNFIPSKIEQDGYLGNSKNIRYNAKHFIFVLKVNNLVQNSFVEFDTWSNYILLHASGNGEVVLGYNSKTTLTKIYIEKDIDNLFEIILPTPQKIIIRVANAKTGVQYFEKILETPFNNISYTNDIVLNPMFYSRELEQQEIQHNLSVLNNSPSVKSIEVTSSTGDKTALLISSDEEHVEMRTGRTLQEEYMSLLKQHGKEFTSTGGAITVNNGIKGRVISGEIKGQTIKNELISVSTTNTPWVIDGTKYIYSGGSFSNIRGLIFNANLVVGKEYTVILNITQNTIQTTGVNVFFIGDSTNLGSANFIPITTTGLIKKKITPTSVNGLVRMGIDASVVTSGTITIEGLTILEGDWTSRQEPCTKHTPFGLSSTQAILSSNGIKYNFYEPTIQGKTRILNADGVEVLPGTTGAKLVSLEPQGSTELIANLPKLGSLPNGIIDVVDRASRLCTLNTFKETVLTDNWTYRSDITIEGVLCSKYSKNVTHNITRVNQGTMSCLLTNVYATNYSTVATTSSRDIINSVGSWSDGVNNTIYLIIPKADSIKQFDIIYQLATPQSIQLTDEQMKTYDAYKKVILLGGLDVARNTLQLMEDGSAIFVDKYARYSSNELTKLNWVLQETREQTLRFNFTGCIAGKANGQQVLSSKLPFNDIFSKDVEGVNILSTAKNVLSISVAKTKLRTQDVVGFIEFLSDMSVFYEKEIPTVTNIPKEIVPLILTDKINILNVESAVAPSSFTVNVPTSDGVKKEFVLTLQNSWTGSLKALLLQNGRVRIVGAITAPSTFANIIANLPTEVKPTVSRKIIGLNENTPIAIEIDTVPTIKCPTTVTGSIEIDAEYEL